MPERLSLRTVVALALALVAAVPRVQAARAPTRSELKKLVRAMKADRKNHKTWLNLGNAFWRGKDFRRAARMWTKAADLKPCEARLRYLAGRAYARSGRFSAAAGLWRQALALDSEAKRARAYLKKLADRGEIQPDQVGPAATVPGCASVVPPKPPVVKPPPKKPLNPNDPLEGIEIQDDAGAAALAWEAARRELGIGEPQKAIGYLQDAYAAGKDPSDVYLVLGQALLEDEQVDPAVFILEKAVATAPGDHLALFYQGKALGLKGDTAGAIDSYQRVLEVDPEFHEAHFYLAVAYDRAGNSPQVLAHAQKAIRADSEYKERLKPLIKDSETARKISEIVKETLRLGKRGQLSEEQIDELVEQLVAILGDENLNTDDMLGPGDRRQRIRTLVNDVQENRGREAFDSIPAKGRVQFLAAIKKNRKKIDPQFLKQVTSNFRKLRGK